MSYDNPTRYELNLNGDDSALEPAGSGDWVTYDDYNDLLAAYEKATAKLEEIARIL